MSKMRKLLTRLRVVHLLGSSRVPPHARGEERVTNHKNVCVGGYISIFFSPRSRFVFQTEISGKHIVLVLISLLFYFFSSPRRGDQSTAFCIAIFRLERNPVGGTLLASVLRGFFRWTHAGRSKRS